MDSEHGLDGKAVNEKSDCLVGESDRKAAAAEFVRLALMEKPGLRAWKFNREELYEERS